MTLPQFESYSFDPMAKKFSPEICPMRSLGQFEIGDAAAPDHYSCNILGPLRELQGELHWHAYDLCRFHQIMYGDLKQRALHVDSEHKRFSETMEEQRAKISEDEREAFMSYESRMNSSFMDKDLEHARVKQFADEFSVIGLWATAERYLGKVFANIVAAQDGVSVESVSRPYRWNEFKSEFGSLGIDLTTLNGYADADECRVLNNTIKHGEFVDQRLAQYAFFSTHVGVNLTKLEFEMQRYLTGIFNFCGAMIEAGNKLLDSNFEC